MDMQQLLYFIEVAKEKHMTNAAKNYTFPNLR